MNESASITALPDLVERVAASVVGVATRREGSSGTLWRAGVAVASATAIWRAPRVSLVLPDGEQVGGTVHGIDFGTDIAAVTLESGSTPVADRDAGAEPRVGDAVFAVGRRASGLVHASFGHVGAVAGEWRTWRGGRVTRLVQLDGGLYPGLEGAPVADAAGRVIGMASPAFSHHHGVVLPVATVDRVLDELLAHGRVRHGYLGIAAQPARVLLEGETFEGLLVSSVAEDSPAARGGLLVGDVIVQVDDARVRGMASLHDRLAVGTTLRLRVSRGGRAETLAIEVGQRPERRRC